MINTIQQAVEKLQLNESQNFTISYDDETGKALVNECKGYNDSTFFGNIEFIENRMISSSEDPFPMFATLDDKYEKIDEYLIKDKFSQYSKIEEGKTYKYFKKRIDLNFPSTTSFSLWSDSQKDVTYLVGVSIPEEEGEHGYFGLLFLSKLIKVQK